MAKVRITYNGPKDSASPISAFTAAGTRLPKNKTVVLEDGPEAEAILSIVEAYREEHSFTVRHDRKAASKPPLKSSIRDKIPGFSNDEPEDESESGSGSGSGDSAENR